MKVEINNKEYQVNFNYSFVKHVMAKKKWTKFSQYDKFIQQFAFDEKAFGPQHLELFAELLILGVESVKENKIDFTKDDVIDVLWSDMGLLAKVGEYFVSCQPKAESVVDPSQRLGK